MASFIESATLALNDDTSGKVNKINKSLDGLFKRMKKLQTLADKEIDIKFKASSINNAVRTIERAQKKLRDFGNTTVEAKLRINTSDVVDKLAAVKRTANFATNTVMRIDTRQALQQIAAVKSRANSAVNAPLRLQTQAVPAANQFSNTVLARASGWGKAFSRVVVGELGQVMRQTLLSGGRKAGEGIMSLSDANLALEMAVGGRSDAESVMKTIRDLALEISTGPYKGISQAGLIELGTEAVSNLASTDPASLRGMMELSARNAAMLGALEKNVDAGNEQARILNKINAQLNVASDPVKAAKYDAAIIAQRAASGADFGMQTIANMLQQLPPALKKVMTPTAVARLGNIREEGGRQSTADVRSAFNDLLRNNLSKADKIAMSEQGIEFQSEADKEATRRFLGLRKGDLTAQNAIVEAAGRDPVEFALKSIMPLLLKNKVNIDSYGAMQNWLDAEAGFTTSGAKFWSDIIGSRDQIAIGDKSRSGTKAEAALKRDASLRQSMNRFDQQFQNVAARATESIVPLANEALQTITDTLAKQAEGQQLTAADWAKIAAGAGTLGLGAGVMGLMDPQTRPLAAAGLALTGAATALTGAAGALTGAAVVSGAGNMFGKAGSWIKALGSAFLVGSVIADSAEIDKKTGKPVGIKNALLDLVADVAVAGKDKEAWKKYNAEQTINSQPFNVLPPMNRAEMRDAGMFSGGAQSNTESLRTALTTTTTDIKVAGEQAAGGIAGAVGTGASVLGAGIVEGATTAAGIIAQAIASAASQVRVAVSSQSPNAPAPVNTGQNNLGHR